MDDDIPHEDSLTWEKIYGTVGDGAWVDMGGIYTYLYQKDDRRSFSSDEWGVEYSLYWGGSLGYCSDTWVDGRYINKVEYFSPVAMLSDHPESNILITEIEMPELIDYEREWDYTTNSYVYSSANIVTANRKNVLFRYDSENQIWKANVSWGSYNNSFGTFETLAQQGVIDEKYYEMLILTQYEAEAIIQNGNTNITPDRGYIFDGRAEIGAPFLKGDANNDGEVSVADAVMLQKWLLTERNELTCWRNVDLCKDNKIDVFDLCLLKRMLIET